ncbi:MAG: cyclic nucleotide-binding domain-containing protein [Acidobacteriota bacterium]
MILNTKKIYGRFIGQPIYAEDLFSNLSPTTRKKIALIQERKEIKEGEIISKIGSFPKNISVLIEGKAQISLRNELNKKNNSRFVEKGEIIGLTQFFSNSPNEMNIVALSPCFLDVIVAEDFLKFLKNEPLVCFRLLSQLSLDIQSSYQTFSSMFF